MRGVGLQWPMTRRAILALLAAAGAAGVPGSASSRLAGVRRSARSMLANVRQWGCQYQKVDIDAVAASGLDMIVLDPSLDDDSGRMVTREECARLQVRPDGQRRIVLAYLCVGEAGVTRWYWPRQWRTTPPAWVGPENPAWAGARTVRYWTQEWRDLIFEAEGSLLDQILRAGYDGVFLDRVDAYGDWEKTHPGARQSMIDLVGALGRKARAGRDDFIVMVQNAEALLASSEFVDLIDGYNKESLLTGLSGENTFNKPEDVAWSLERIMPLREAGVPLFATEYCTEPRLVARVRERLRELGFVPFFSTPALDRLPEPNPQQEAKL